MSIKNNYRKFKLSKLNYLSIDYENELIENSINMFENLTCFKHKKIDTCIFYGKSKNDIVFYTHKDSNRVFIDDGKYDVLRYSYNINSKELDILLKIILKDFYKIMPKKMLINSLYSELYKMLLNSTLLYEY